MISTIFDVIVLILICVIGFKAYECKDKLQLLFAFIIFIITLFL